MSGVTTAVIPVAGKGSRLAALGLGADKAMLPVGGTPLLSRVVGEAVEAGLRELVVVVGTHNRSAIGTWLDALAWGSGDPPAFAHTLVVQTEPSGLGDALLMCRPYLGKQPFAVLLPDNVFWGTAPPIGALVQNLDTAHSNLVGLITVDQRTAPLFSDSGLCETVPLGSGLYRIDSLVGKGTGSLAVDRERLKTCGRQVYLPGMWDVLERLSAPPGEELDDVELLQTLAASGELAGIRLSGTLLDVGNPAGYRAACRYAWKAERWWR